MNRFLYIALLVLVGINLYAQENLKWDDVRSKDWPEECTRIIINSSVDGKEQPAYLYKSESKEPRPLIVSLQTWSGGYDQKDTLSWQCIDKDYNYIHPHFRGTNNTYVACGSTLALSDIEDAIDYALENTRVDTSNIHICGVSGGGYSTLLTYMHTKHKIRSFSAWVPISNLIDWYHESEGRKNKYSRDIALSTTGEKFGNENYYFNETEARKRSPIFMNTPVEERLNSKLFIYAGGHERINNVALDHVRGKSILTIGDSNGELEKGWVFQLQQLRFEDKIFNTCISGNTIGFNNLGTAKRNTLLNVDRFIHEGYDAMGEMDAIVIMLGTNDCKAVFDDSLKLVPGNMQNLISKIKVHEVYRQFNPQIYIVSPPPVGPENVLIAKYHGSVKRIEFLQSEFKKVAETEDCIFVDCYSELKENFELLSVDGIHLTPEGQKIIAKTIDQKIKENSAKSR
ncbi:GDSL-type esterase/lipase family protein [Bacteroidota bacterium]